MSTPISPELPPNGGRGYSMSQRMRPSPSFRQNPPASETPASKPAPPSAPTPVPLYRSWCGNTCRNPTRENQPIGGLPPNLVSFLLTLIVLVVQLTFAAANASGSAPRTEYVLPVYLGCVLLLISVLLVVNIFCHPRSNRVSPSTAPALSSALEEDEYNSSADDTDPLLPGDNGSAVTARSRKIRARVVRRQWTLLSYWILYLVLFVLQLLFVVQYGGENVGVVTTDTLTMPHKFTAYISFRILNSVTAAATLVLLGTHLRMQAN